MRNDFCTGYLAHSAKGKEWGKHKYVAKVKLANGKYFYFYNLDQYQAYLKRRSNAERQKVDEKAKTELAGKDSTLKKSDSKSSTSSMTAEEKRQAAIERVKGATGSSSSKKKGSSSSKSKKSSSKSGSGKSSSSSKSKGSTSKEKTAKESSSSGSTKKASSEKEKTTKTTASTTAQTQQAEETTKQTPSLSSYKYQYDLKDDDISTYSGAETDRVSTNRVQEIIDDMVDKYPEESSGYLLSSFSDSITYQFKWVKEGGTIKLLDPDTGTEVAADTSLTNAKSVSLFRTDDKTKKS